MKIIEETTYSNYKHSYAYAIDPKIKFLGHMAFKDPSKTVSDMRAVIIKTLEESEVNYTDKCIQFITDVNTINNKEALYWRCRNACRIAKKTEAKIGENGRLVDVRKLNGHK